MGQLGITGIRAFRLPAALFALAILGFVIYATWSPSLASAMAYDVVAVLSTLAVVAGVILYRSANRAACF